MKNSKLSFTELIQTNMKQLLDDKQSVKVEQKKKEPTFTGHILKFIKFK
ncbi:FbpB family small basic protein [Aquibacillus rhizosphaerae]|uniref:Uncharacterized protein n=1 Tax=Aquibacillus rhizosphaerae TaxID=3051431 RepID=A0ABT7L957_9BACI|nr:FbpB family small basic protein [Aquibacillus sp. LR5S19]MDL4841909.1 hypothetical protein [Aquibacillus sp. LR5S19]